MLARLSGVARASMMDLGDFMMRSSTFGLAVAIVFACGLARADDEAPPPQTPKPWAVGVSDDRKATAQQHLDAGNALFLEHKYAEALEEYKQANASWEHPAIRFNMVRCLIFLERPLEASENLNLALAYGAAPYDEAIYGEALAYEKLLASQIGEVEINCDQDGVQLTFDGQALLACPGKELRRVLPGQHQIVGKKDGFLPRTVEIVVLGGKHEHEGITLEPLSKAARITHRWPTWVPWTVFGGGLAVGGIGELLQLQATANLASYTDQISKGCATGCRVSNVEIGLRDRALLENKIAIGVAAAGIAAAATGIVMVYLNRGRVVYESSIERRFPTSRIDVLPQGGGAIVIYSWSR
jgi:tetratricopeptide (TPR) repeat protein